MVKFKKTFLLSLIILCLANICYATTKEELIQAINKTYTVGSETYTLPENVKLKGINYLRTHYFTEEQCTEIMGCINSAVSFANQLGTTDISKISAEDVQKGLSYARRAAAIAEKAPKLEDVQKEIKNDNKTNAVVQEDDLLDDEKINASSVSIEEDLIDYSKYISESQYEDVEFNDFKDSIIDEAKKYSLKKFLPYILAIVFVLCFIIIFNIIKKVRKKKREEDYEK